MAKIAIQTGLDEYAAHLSDAGYDVEEFFKDTEVNSHFLERYDALVLSQYEGDLLSLEQDLTNTASINSDNLNNKDTILAQGAVNGDHVHQNILGTHRNTQYGSKPVVFVNRKTVEQVRSELDSIFTS